MFRKQRFIQLALALGALVAASSCDNAGAPLEETTSALSEVITCTNIQAVPSGYFRDPDSCKGSGGLPVASCMCYLSSPPNPIVTMDWSMPDQTGIDTDGDGIVNLSPPGNPPTAGSFAQTTFAVDISACNSTPAPAYSWDLTGPGVQPIHSDLGPDGCMFTPTLPQGTFHTVVTLKYANGWRTFAKDVVVKNFLIVSMGDSIASGEGNPDIPLVAGDPGSGFLDQVGWENRSCHRSAKSGPALAALQLEQADPHSSVTFISEACSGASIQALPGVAMGGGVLTPYQGEEPLPSGQTWEAQLGAMARVLCPSGAGLPVNPGANWTNPVKSQCRFIDALLIQAGANDVGFGTAAEACALPSFDCSQNGAVTQDIANGLVALPADLDTLGASIKSGLNVGKVFFPEYPDILHGDSGALCNQIILPNAVANAVSGGVNVFEGALARWGLSLAGDSDGQMTAAEIKWLHDFLLVPMNQKIAAAAQRNGWVDVDGIDNDFQTHGYCASSPWVVSYVQSIELQDNPDGTFHPNAQGHADYASHIATSIIDNVPGATVLGNAVTGKESFTTGDFNGDGKTDMIVTTAAGSTWYFSNGDGTWEIPYVRTDLPLGKVQYVPGDFDGDGKTDLIIITAGGSYWYFSNGDGTWRYPYTRTDLPLGTVTYITGNFNRDNKTDLVIVDASGSYWYLSNGDGTWTYPYTRTDLPSSVAKYVAGDFDGDTLTDLIITTPSGSYWYYSLGNGTFTCPFSRADLPLGVPTFTVGDFDGNSKADMIVQTTAGSQWFFSTGRGTWTNPYNRSDLTTANTVYVPADFDGNGKTDLAIVDPAGTYWYFSNGDGTWTNPYTRGDLPLGIVRYTPGNFNSDKFADLIITDPIGSFWYFGNGAGGWTAPYIRSDLVY